MAIPFNNSGYALLTGDCLSVLQQMEDNTVDCVITSPPYWGMRKYDQDDNENEVGNETEFCDYVAKLTTIFGEIKRVLVPSGSFWLNVGDKYNNKELMGMPWRIALSLIDKGGWIMRNDVIWNQRKGTQSCKDRLRDSYEHFFHFVKSKKYYYDSDAIRIKPTKHPQLINGSIVSSTGVSGVKYKKIIETSDCLTPEEKAAALKCLNETLLEVQNGTIVDFRMTIRGAQRAWHSNDASISGRAKELDAKGFYVMKMGAKGHIPSDIWNVVTEDTWRKDDHCAVFPEELLRIPILATSPQGGIVLDPFCGTGSTVAAALKLGRKGVGIDLSPEYIKTSSQRLNKICPTIF